jgi:hypothetical protein
LRSPVETSRNRFGNPGDRLWEWYFVDMTLASAFSYRYEAEAGAAPAWHKRPALFMPTVASRIALEIVQVRTERLQEISVGDALAEGIGPDGLDDPVQAYRGVWERINGAGSWEEIVRSQQYCCSRYVPLTFWNESAHS